jgi:hypothetical protein
MRSNRRMRATRSPVTLPRQYRVRGLRKQSEKQILTNTKVTCVASPPFELNEFYKKGAASERGTDGNS